MLVIPLIQNFQQQEIEFWLIELVSWIRYLRERLLLKDLMMMGKMEQVKSFCIFYKKWKLKILLSFCAFGIVESKLDLNS
jgi:uncharacterized LabA/DUF88 family protein